MPDPMWTQTAEAREADRQSRNAEYERVCPAWLVDLPRFVSEGVVATGAVWPHAVVWTDLVTGERQLFPCAGDMFRQQDVDDWKRGILERERVERSCAA